MTKPDILLVENFIPNHTELFHMLRQSIDWDNRMKARKTASFGVSYNYSGITYPATEMPSELTQICHLITARVGYSPNNCLMNYYLNGSSKMGFHSDSAEELLPGTGVSIISLGQERDIAYKSKINKELVYRYQLKGGTLLYMDELVQQNWLHAIPKSLSNGERISLTFRHIIK